MRRERERDVVGLMIGTSAREKGEEEVAEEKEKG